MPKITTIEYFRVPPRWLYVKITADNGGYGWGEASLEGHTEAVEGALEELRERLVGCEAKCVLHNSFLLLLLRSLESKC
jgi:galactonate dehydratase